MAPPVFVMYRRCGSSVLRKVELGCASSVHNVGTPARPVARSRASIETISRAKTNFIRISVPPCWNAVMSWFRPASKLNGRIARIRSAPVMPR